MRARNALMNAKLLVHRRQFIPIPYSPDYAIICMAPYVGLYALSNPEKK
jgi:hypothetical protein